ncbi:ATP-dependent helicase HrpB [Rhodobacteraceae bacterium CCMM004]|nr:ATP-dependent helicase HrpB [Rhodobacteraceae bacterium CCMM004]
MRLPVDDALPPLIAALRRGGRAVLQAPPGAGKTTRVPLALLDAGLTEGRIVLLEPRRLAARAAAERMAETLGEPVGRRVGYRMRGDTRVSSDTRIEVVTEGILTRMLQSAPDLPGVGAVLFDEFHERSLHADLGLALTWEVRGALRPDLIVVAMSATLDAGPVAALLDDAPTITSEGRAHPVETRWRDAPVPKGLRLPQAAAETILAALTETEGGVLTFLPGEGEIRRTLAALDGALPPGVVARPLYGALPFADQRAAVRPEPAGRKLVLATAIAETSLTIADVRVVVDAGQARRARFDPGSGMSRLVTERVTRAEADQRRGRAGRVAPGVCYRMWTRGAEGGLAAFPPPEIEAADLAPLALELALWGAADPADLPFLTPPPEGALAEARALLQALGALDGTAITAHGRRLAAMPLHPRLAHMLELGGKPAADLVALLSERDVLRGAGADLRLRIEALRHPDRFGAAVSVVTRRMVRDEARRLAKAAPAGEGTWTPEQLAAMAYPDRIGLRRKGDAPRWLLSGGKGAALAEDDPLAAARLIVVTDTDGDPREARIRQAVEIAEADLRVVHGAAIAWHDLCAWSRREGRVVARRQERLGALVLDDRTWPDAPDDALARAMLEGARQIGLAPGPVAARFLARVALGRAAGLPLFDPDPEALLAEAEDWLLPYLSGVRTAAAWRALDLTPALRARLDWDTARALDDLVPATVTTPLGRRVPVDYSGDAPEIAVRLQEMFGTTRHPLAGGVPVRIVLLSPAGRPVQVTQDLPGFWTASYADVRKEMRGRYPRHPWPEDPTAAAPTLRARPRGT